MSSGIYKRTEETRLKMSLLKIGKKRLPFSNETKEKMKKNHKGMLDKHHTEKTKMSLANKGKGRKLSKETRKKISESHKGKKHSEETKKKISIVHKGKKWTKKRRKKISGKNCHLWKGGTSFEPYSIDWTETLRRSIRERDKYTCQICGKEPSIHCHHIDYNKKNCNPENLITLCNSCHIKTNFNREKWIEYFGIALNNKSMKNS